LRQKVTEVAWCPALFNGRILLCIIDGGHVNAKMIISCHKVSLRQLIGINLLNIFLAFENSTVRHQVHKIPVLR
jgi:hypothetical protein